MSSRSSSSSSAFSIVWSLLCGVPRLLPLFIVLFTVTLSGCVSWVSCTTTEVGFSSSSLVSQSLSQFDRQSSGHGHSDVVGAGKVVVQLHRVEQGVMMVTPSDTTPTTLTRAPASTTVTTTTTNTPCAEYRHNTFTKRQTPEKEREALHVDVDEGECEYEGSRSGLLLEKRMGQASKALVARNAVTMTSYPGTDTVYATLTTTVTPMVATAVVTIGGNTVTITTTFLSSPVPSSSISRAVTTVTMTSLADRISPLTVMSCFTFLAVLLHHILFLFS